MRAQAGSCLQKRHRTRQAHRRRRESLPGNGDQRRLRSEEHTSELQSRLHLVCRLLLEKKKNHTDRPFCPHRFGNICCRSASHTSALPTRLPLACPLLPSTHLSYQIYSTPTTSRSSIRL